MRSSSVAAPSIRSPRLLVVALAGSCAVAGSAWALGTVLLETLRLVGSPGRASFDELVVGASSLAALSLLAWVALGVLVSVAACLPGRMGALGARLEDRIAPAFVRRTAALLLGVSILSACGPGGAVADEPGATTAVTAAAVLDTAPTPAWPPQAEAETPEPAAALRPAAPPAPEWTPAPVRALPPVTLTSPRVTVSEPTPQEVTVHRGDTLWDLAAAHLSADAADAEIAAAWQRWWALNRDVIGDDPDLILPGQVLRVPELSR